MPPRTVPIIQEDRKLAVFVLDNPPKLKEDETFQGWSNSATYTFRLYFFQENDLVDEIFKMIQTRGNRRTINLDLAMELFRKAQKYNRMEQIDADCDGLVYVKEIISDYLYETRPMPIRKRSGPGRSGYSNFGAGGFGHGAFGNSRSE